jgi:hypothetical protein
MSETFETYFLMATDCKSQVSGPSIKNDGHSPKIKTTQIEFQTDAIVTDTHIYDYIGTPSGIEVIANIQNKTLNP